MPHSTAVIGRLSVSINDSLEQKSVSTNRLEDNLQVPARTIPVSEFLSVVARNYLRSQPGSLPYPALEDKEGWRNYVIAADQAVIPLLRSMSAQIVAEVIERDADGAQVYNILAAGVAPDDRSVVLEMHGGALILCGGELCRGIGTATSARLRRRIWSVDYRMCRGR